VPLSSKSGRAWAKIRSYPENQHIRINAAKALKDDGWIDDANRQYFHAATMCILEALKEVPTLISLLLACNYGLVPEVMALQQNLMTWFLRRAKTTVNTKEDKLTRDKLLGIVRAMESKIDTERKKNPKDLDYQSNCMADICSRLYRIECELQRIHSPADDKDE
jgi:hypothetical protein